MVKVLVVVDMQRDFVDGALGTAQAAAIVPAVVEKIRAFDGRVLMTMDTHSQDYLQTQEGRNLPVPHCVKDTQGWLLNEDVRLAVMQRGQGVTLFEKPCFGSVKLMEYLKDLDRKEGIESIEMVGLCTDVCVISNALLAKAHLVQVPVSVDARCCAGVTPQNHENALSAMAACQVMITGR